MGPDRPAGGANSHRDRAVVLLVRVVVGLVPVPDAIDARVPVQAFAVLAEAVHRLALTEDALEVNPWTVQREALARCLEADGAVEVLDLEVKWTGANGDPQGGGLHDQQAAGLLGHCIDRCVPFLADHRITDVRFKVRPGRDLQVQAALTAEVQSQASAGDFHFEEGDEVVAEAHGREDAKLADPPVPQGSLRAFLRGINKEKVQPVVARGDDWVVCFRRHGAGEGAELAAAGGEESILATALQPHDAPAPLTGYTGLFPSPRRWTR
jgi:hypothetical protein